ncbi:hypothetical protein WA588_006097 [Blastocystis sp. NMH]
MDDEAYRRTIDACSRRLVQLQPSSAIVTKSVPKSQILAFLAEYANDDLELVSVCVNAELIWICMLYSIQQLSKPLIPFELLENQTINLEYVCALTSLLPKENLSVLECALDVCTCVLFPDLSSDAKESSPVDISEVFPNVVSTIGYSICRPVHGTFLSVAHKRGFESISILLTLFLDNQRWLFSSSAPFSIPTFHSSLPAPSPSAIPSLLASTLLTTYSTHFSSFHDATHHLEQISLFVDYGANPLIPRPVDEDITKPMIAEELYDIQTVVLGSQEMHTASLPIRMAGRDSDIPFNERAEEAIHQTEAQVELMACVLLQSWIRQKNAAFVHTHFRDDSITLLPKRSQCCIIRKSTALPDIDFAAYFTESDWLVSPSQVEGWEREEILSLVQTLQLQLLNVEKVIHGPLRQAIVTDTPFLLNKYAFYYTILGILSRKR